MGEGSCGQFCVSGYVSTCAHFSVCFHMGFGVHVSLIDGRIKTTPFCGILIDHIVKELGDTGSQWHDKDSSHGSTQHNQNSSLFNFLLWRSCGPPEFASESDLLVWEAPTPPAIMGTGCSGVWSRKH